MAVAGLTLARVLFLGLLTWFLWQLYRAMQADLGRARQVADSPVAGALALVSVAGSGMLAPGRRFRIDGELTIGRLPDNLVQVADDFASGHHARVWLDGGRCVLEDLNSTNGTLVDGRVVRGAVELRPGSRVQIGTAVLELRAERE